MRRTLKACVLAALVWAASDGAECADKGGGPEADGDSAYAAGDFKKAVKCYKRAVDKNPASGDLHFKLGRAYLKKGSMDDGMPELIRASQLDPRHEGALQILGDVFLQKNEVDKALKAYEALVKVNPESAPYNLQAAKVYAKQGRKDDAVDTFFKAVQLAPDLEEAYPPLVALLKERLLANASDPDTHAFLGRVYKLHREYGEAKSQFAVALEARPNDQALWEELLDVCRKMNDCKCEVMAWEGMLPFTSRQAEVMGRIVETARGCRMREVAVGYLEKMVAADLANPSPYLDLAKLYREGGNRTLAYFNYRKYLELCAGCPDSDDIRRWCESEDLADPVLDTRFKAFKLFQSGVAAFKDADFTGALAQFEAARGVFPAFPQLHFFIGQTLEELGRRHDALFAYKEAVKLQVANPEYWFILGRALISEKMVSDAVTCLRKVIEIDPDDKSGYAARAQKLLQTVRDQGIINP